ncbi:hypothetical protein JKP88DRAFT_283939 [Tribonema minus]|uniref:Uncharacterized protein n=1 Tax=Tribonema minus TaxID=303371 RepID=A0A836C7U7_9STRA|nr:hypothetical protein JKP88DRAFT_283939 [Tribonema minus]
MGEPKSSEEQRRKEKHRHVPAYNPVADPLLAIGAGLFVYSMLMMCFPERMRTVSGRARAWNASLPKALAAQIMVRQSRVDTKVSLTRLRDSGFELKELPDGKHILLEGKGMPGEHMKLTFEKEASPLVLADVSILMTVEKGGEALGFSLNATKHEVELRRVALLTAPIPAAGTSDLNYAVTVGENSRYYRGMDTQLCDGFDAYLRERGINKGLIKIVRTYAELKAASKEQQKDLQWIHKVQGFVIGK